MSDGQFAGHRTHDNSAVCLTCRHQHLLPRGEAIESQSWLDWLAKHPRGHETFIVPTSLLTSLGDKVALAHNADVKNAYAATSSYTLTATGLATSSTLLAGREATSVSVASDKYLDMLVAGVITTGTTPTTAKIIEITAVGALDDTPTWPDVFDGTDSAETVTSAEIKVAICKPLLWTLVDATSDRPYPMGPTSLRACFGELPVHHTLFLSHSTAVNLNATAANHYVKRTPVYKTVT